MVAAGLDSAPLKAIGSLMGELLDAVEEPILWPSFLARLATELGSQRVMLLRAEGVRRVVLATNELDPLEVRRLAGRRLAAGETPSVTLPPVYRELNLGGDPGLRLLVDRTALGSEAEQLLELLGPLIARAWRLTDALASSRRNLGLSRTVLDELPTGVLVLDSAGGVLFMNPAARRQLASQQELRIEQGYLRAQSQVLQRTISELLARATRFEGRGVETELMLLPREAPWGPVEMLLVASPRFLDSDPNAVGVALLFDPRREEENPTVILARRYHLGFEDRQVLSLLLRGRDIPEIALTLDVPRAAVEACLRNLYEHIGTTRQVELIKLLLSRPRTE